MSSLKEAAAIRPGSSGDNGSSLAEQAHLTYIVPAQSNFDVEKSFQTSRQGKSVLDSIERRESLFFGTIFSPR